MSSSNHNNHIGKENAMETLKKERVKNSSQSKNEEDYKVGGKFNGSISGGMSEGEEGDILCVPLNTNGHNNRKRIKLQGKVFDDYSPVDPAMVPRRLRSAINRRLCQSLSPPLSDLKRKHLHPLKRAQLSNGYLAERFKQNMLDQVTKDEEEVAEALTMLASPINGRNSIKNKEDRITLPENLESKAALPSFSEALKGTKKVLLPCNGSIGTNPFPHVEESQKDDFKHDSSALEQQTVTNQTTQPNSCMAPSANNGKEGNVTSLRDALNSSSPLGISFQYLVGNGGLQQTELVASSMQRCDIGLWPLGSAPIGHNLQSANQKFDSATANYTSQIEVTREMCHGTSSSAHGHLAMSSSSKVTGCARSVTASARCSSSRNDLPIEMLSSVDGKAPCKKCITHVYITHLIQNYQNKESRQQPSLPVIPTKAEEGRKSPLQMANGTAEVRNSKIPSSSDFHMEKRSLDGKTQMLQAQLFSTLSGAYAPQKQVGEFLSISVADTKNSGNGPKSSGQFHVPYFPHHSLMPFPFPQGPYSSHYQEQLAAAACHQVQLQLPHFADTGPSYGPQMVRAAGDTTAKQQQQIWQAQMGQMANYKPPPSFPAKWQQNGQNSDSFPSPSTFPFLKDYQSANTQKHFLLPVPASSPPLPPKAMQHQQLLQHNGVKLNLGASTQLQMTFR